MDFFVQALRNNPELAIFLTLAIGFLIGRVKIGSFSLGTVVGTLLAGVLIGQLDIQVPSVVKAVFFDLFLFTTGYKVGPQFFRGAASAMPLPQVALTVVLCVTCLLTAFVFAKILGYDIGTAAGLLAGAFSESTVIGTAGDAIQRLSLSDADKLALVNNIPVAYAVTYLVGTAGLVWFLPTVGPRLMGVNLKEEGREAAGRGRGLPRRRELGVFSAARHFDARAYRVTNPELRRTGPWLTSRPCPRTPGSSSSRIRRGGEIIEPDTRHGHPRGTTWSRSSPGRRSTWSAGPDRPRGGRQGPARHPDRDPGRGGHPPSPWSGRPWRSWHGSRSPAGCSCGGSPRAGQEIPIAPWTRIDRGDVLRLIGPKPEVERAAKDLGYADRRPRRRT